MAHFVLVPGAWHGAWCWERIVPLLEARGHVAVPVELAGMGNDRTARGEVTLAGWADQVAAIVRAAPEPVILVGHSRGGIVISEAAERVPHAIATTVYLAAMLVPSGQSLANASESVAEQASGLDFLIMAEDGTSTVRSDAVVPTFYNETPAEWAERARRMLGPEPMMSFTTPLSLSDDRFGHVPRAYIECLRDQAIPVAMQREMQRRLPCGPVVPLDCDHSPFYSDPMALVGALESIAARAGAAMHRPAPSQSDAQPRRAS